MTIKLYTMKALAALLGTSYGYMRQQMLKIKKGELTSWRGYKFLPVGEGKRSSWLAYPEELDIEVVDVPEEDL